MKRIMLAPVQFSRLVTFVFLASIVAMSGDDLFGQPPAKPEPGQTQAKPDSDVVQVIIKKNAVHLMQPEKFQAPISLEPVQSLEVRAKVAGVVKNVRVKLGATVRAQEEMIQIESKQAKLVLEHAKALLKAATIKKELVAKEVAAGKQPQIALDLAEAEINVAKTKLSLAQLNIENSSVRAVFSGRVKKIMTTNGAIVNQSDLLLVLVDTSELIAQIPVDREKVKVGETIEVKLDNQIAKGKVKAMLPLEGKWQALRQIVDTASIAVVAFNNQSGEFEDGQTAYSPIVPHHPVIEVPNLALRNSETGTRIIQVVRDGMIRDIEVQLLGPLGEGRSYVCGPVQENDELIAESSRSLADGTLIKPAAVVNTPGKKKSTPSQPTRTPGASPF